MAERDNWYYADDGEQRGPFEAREVPTLIGAGAIRRDTLVWNPGMADWQFAEESLPIDLKPADWGGGATPPPMGTMSGGAAAPLSRDDDNAITSPHPQGFVECVRHVFSNYATFRGRARRPEFWWFVLFLFIGNTLCSFLDAALFGGASTVSVPGGTDVEGGPIGLVFSLVTLLPTIAVTARRLHDVGRSGWWQVAPYLGIVLIVFGGVGLMLLEDTPNVTDGSIVFLLGALLSVGLAIALLVFLVKRGDPGPNRFGPA